jgi:hypothetical protein
MATNSNVEILAGRFRAANVMGRSEALRKLLDFLVARSGDSNAPKELEVAAAIFGAGANFDTSQDASVRVYIHRLRQKLDEYYAGAGQNESERLTIPKGVGYRIIAEPLVPLAKPVQAAPPARSGASLRHWVIAAVLLLLLVTGATGWLLFWQASHRSDEFAAIRTTPLWNGLLSDSRSITLVVGDYYIFGENTDNAGANRLVREYSINSPNDLDNYLMEHPALAGRYMDLDLYYLPVSAAAALKSIMPILAPNAAARDRIHVIQASELTPDMIKRTNIVYIGYLSGLGLLREAVFAGSRFSVGSTYDELIDNEGKHSYVSQEGGPDDPDRKLKDFGYFSTFTGPGGNRIMIIAGTRDIGVMQTAESVTSQDSVGLLTSQSGNSKAYEALYEVEGIKRSNLSGRLLMVSPLHADKIWNSQPAALQFPNG